MKKSCQSVFSVRDASGNILALYEKQVDGETVIKRLKELHLYGSSRLGMLMPSMADFPENYVNLSPQII